MRVTVLLLVALIAGCAAAPRPAFIFPFVDITASDLGKGRRIALNAIDMRSDKKLGDAEVVAPDYDLALSLGERLAESLRQQGFKVVTGNATPELKFELLELKYDTSQSSEIKGVLTTEAAIKVTVSYNGGSYQNTYRGKNEERDLLVPSANDIERLLNNNLAEILRRIATNSEVLMALRRE